MDNERLGLCAEHMNIAIKLICLSQIGPLFRMANVKSLRGIVCITWLVWIIQKWTNLDLGSNWLLFVFFYVWAIQINTYNIQYRRESSGCILCYQFSLKLEYSEQLQRDIYIELKKKPFELWKNKFPSPYSRQHRSEHSQKFAKRNKVI